ncbi:hypothetical protein GCM10023080_039330 [Streptomyces pseudoechinosporeus]
MPRSATLLEGPDGRGMCPVPLPVTHLPDVGTRLTVRTTYRQPGRVPPELLLYERVYVDLARNASARCPVC